MSKQLAYIPKFMRKSKLLQEIFVSSDTQIEYIDEDIKDIYKQLSIDTATWGLLIYEKELGIKSNFNKPIQERRNVIKSKWRGTGKVDSALIKSVADAYTNGDVDVNFIEGRIDIKFNSIYGIPSNLEDVRNSIEDVKPAHLAVTYQFAYLLIKDIHQVKTLNEMQTIKLNKFAGGI